DCSRRCRIRNTPCARGAASSLTSFSNRNFSMNDSRRDFLKLCGLAGLGFACPGGPQSIMQAATKEATPYEGPFYVVFNASGGWDTTYLMDPKGVNEINRLYNEGDILTQGQHKFASSTAWPIRRSPRSSPRAKAR